MQKKRGTTLIEVLAIVVNLILLVFLVRGCTSPQAIVKSKVLGRPLRIELPDNFQGFVNASSWGAKTVTYLDSEGNYRTREYTETGWFQGEIIWLKPK